MEETEHSNRFAKDNQSTDKVLAIIELLSCSKEPMRLIDISNQLNYNTRHDKNISLILKVRFCLKKSCQ